MNRLKFIVLLWSCWIAGFCVNTARNEAVAEDPDVLFETSFENHRDGKFESLQDGRVELKSTGTTRITSQYSRTGQKCLRLLGDTDNSIVLILPADGTPVRGIRFYAERWTARDPFAFLVHARQGNRWRKVAKIDRLITVGARLLSLIQLPLPDGEAIDAIRFQVTAAPESGVLIDDLALLATAPKQPSVISPDAMPREPMSLITQESLFISGENGTHTYRIPAIATATNGDLIAVCDARRKNSSDIVHQRTIDIVFRRSTDNGKNWSPIELLEHVDDGGCSDASLIVDQKTGDLFCFYNFMAAERSHNEYRFYVQRSTDHGATWNPPIDFTDQVAGPELKHAFKFVTSGRGIQTRSGRLVHNFVRVGQGVSLFGSDDHGASWRVLGEIASGDESKVAELPDGTWMVNSRIGPGRRLIHRSSDQGKTWESISDVHLPDPGCNASLIQYTAKRDGFARDRLVFCNAASNSQRQNLAARISYDGGKTWSGGKVIDPGPAAYSEMTILKDGSFGVLYEPGYGEIRFVRFTLEALTSGQDDLKDHRR